MKRILVITVVFCLIGVLTGTAQEVRNDPPEFEKSSTPNDKMQRAWLWSEGTKFTGTTLVFTSDNKIEIKPSKEKLHIYAKKYDSNWVNPSFFFGFKPKAAAWIRTGVHMYADGPNKTIGEDYSDVTFKFENLKIDGLEMTGICTYEISYGFKGDKQLKKLKEDNVPVKFIASRRPAQPNPMVFSPQTLAELEDIRKKCNDSNINNKPSEDILSPIENKTSLVLNGKEITFDIRRGGSSHTIIGNNPYINLPSKGWVDWFTGYQDAMSRAANELGNIILDGLDGKLDGNCMSPDGRRISQLEAEALSDKFSSDLMKYYLDPVKNSYPFSKYLPNDPQKRQAILDICPINKPYRLLNDTGVYNKENDFYLKRNKLLNEANELVKQGKIKEAYGKLINTVYGCKVIDAAEFFANNQTPEPPK